jgi:uncharacterized protein YjbI with pentapeptide repeats
MMRATRFLRTKVHHCERVVTMREKGLLQETVILGSTLDAVDFEGADLRDSRFERVCLSGCDFRNANLLGVRFVECDLMAADFSGARFGNNSFSGSCFSGAFGLTQPQREYVILRGGSFQCSRSPACGVGPAPLHEKNG